MYFTVFYIITLGEQIAENPYCVCRFLCMRRFSAYTFIKWGNPAKLICKMSHRSLSILNWFSLQWNEVSLMWPLCYASFTVNVFVGHVAWHLIKIPWIAVLMRLQSFMVSVAGQVQVCFFFPVYFYLFV